MHCHDHAQQFTQDTGCTPIKFAAQQGNFEIAERLFSKGADVNITDKVWPSQKRCHSTLKYYHTVTLQSGRTALMAAAEGGYKRVVEVLLDLETKHLCDTNIQEKVCNCKSLIIG